MPWMDVGVYASVGCDAVVECNAIKFSLYSLFPPSRHAAADAVPHGLRLQQQARRTFTESGDPLVYLANRCLSFCLSICQWWIPALLAALLALPPSLRSHNGLPVRA